MTAFSLVEVVVALGICAITITSVLAPHRARDDYDWRRPRPPMPRPAQSVPCKPDSRSCLSPRFHPISRTANCFTAAGAGSGWELTLRPSGMTWAQRSPIEIGKSFSRFSCSRITRCPPCRARWRSSRCDCDGRPMPPDGQPVADSDAPKTVPVGGRRRCAIEAERENSSAEISASTARERRGGFTLVEILVAAAATLLLAGLLLALATNLLVIWDLARAARSGGRKSGGDHPRPGFPGL